VATESWRIEIDRTVCVGSALCVSQVPKVFTIADDLRAETLIEVVEADEHVRDVAIMCPMSAIMLYSVETGEEVEL
jgi:ferredoxin